MAKSLALLLLPVLRKYSKRSKMRQPLLKGTRKNLRKVKLPPKVASCNKLP